MAVRDDHGRAAARLVLLHRDREGDGAFGVEVGVRLVHDDHHRRSVERTRQRDALALASGERRSPRRHLEVVPAGQLENHLVRPGALRRLDHCRVIGRRRHPGDVLGHRAVEQRHLLRKVADVPAQHRRSVVLQLRTVEPDRSAERPHHSRQGARQGGLSRCGRTGDADGLPVLQAQRRLAHHREPRAGRGDREVVSFQDRTRLRQRRAHRLRGGLPQQGAERPPGDHRPLQPRPVPDRLIDRSERPPQQDRPGDHESRRELAAQGQPCPQPQHHRLQEQAQRPGDHPVETVAVRDRQRPFQQTVAQRRRTGQDRVEHAESLHGLSPGTHLLDEVFGPGRRLHRLPLQRSRARLVDERDHQQQASREHRQHAHHPVEREQHEQEHGCPGRVEEREGAVAGPEPLDGFQIAQPGGRQRALGRRHRARQDRAQHAWIEPRLQARAGASQHPPARVIEHPHQQEQEGDQDGQREERLL